MHSPQLPRCLPQPARGPAPTPVLSPERSRRAKSRIRRLTPFALILLLSACAAPQTQAPPDPIEFRDYHDLAMQHNARLADLDRLWARAVVEMRWYDEDGRRRYEQGDGPLIVRRPDDLALAIGKLGNTRIWLGANANRYWLFDLNDDERIAYVGEADAPAEALTAGLAAGPLPVRPDAIVSLLGISPLEIDDDAMAARIDDHIVAVLPANDDANAPMPARELRFDLVGRLTRIDMLDEHGRSLLVVELDRFKPMKLEGHPPGAWPDVARHIRLTIGPTTEQPARVDLSLESLTDRPAKFKDAQFDLDRLSDLYKIDRIERLDK